MILPARNAAIESVISLSLRFFRERKKWLQPDSISTKFKVSSIFNIPKKYQQTIQETKKKKPQPSLKVSTKNKKYRKHRDEEAPTKFKGSNKKQEIQET